MWKIALSLVAVFAFAAMAFPGEGMAQTGSYPDRPIRFVAPYGPGGTVDPTARVLAGPVGEILGRPVIVENKPGAAGSIGTEYVVRQPADGHTVLIHTNLVTSEPWLKPSLPYKFLKDMTPVMAINETPFVLLVNPSLPVKTVKEFVDYAKANPGKLNFGASGIGSSGHLRGEQFKLETGVKMEFIPYVDGGATLRGLLGNEIQAAMDTLPGSIGMIQSGTLRLLAVGTSQRWFLVPETPTMKESGFSNVASQWIGAYVRADTPPAIVDKLAKAMKQAANDPRIKEQYRKIGFEVIGEGPEETQKRVKDETEMWRKTVEAAGIKIPQ